MLSRLIINLLNSSWNSFRILENKTVSFFTPIYFAFSFSIPTTGNFAVGRRLILFGRLDPSISSLMLAAISSSRRIIRLAYQRRGDAFRYGSPLRVRPCFRAWMGWGCELGLGMWSWDFGALFIRCRRGFILVFSLGWIFYRGWSIGILDY